MGFFKFTRDFNSSQGKTRIEAECRGNFPIKLVEPNEGKIVTLKVTDKKAKLAEMHMSSLKIYADVLKDSGCVTEYNIVGNKITLLLVSEEEADVLRAIWKQ